MLCEVSTSSPLLYSILSLGTFFPVFVDCWNSYEVGILRRAIPIIFCGYKILILRGAGFSFSATPSKKTPKGKKRHQQRCETLKLRLYKILYLLIKFFCFLFCLFYWEPNLHSRSFVPSLS